MRPLQLLSPRGGEADKPKHAYEQPVIRAIGYLSSEIVSLGPGYEALASSFRVQQDWVSSLSSFCDTAADTAAIRRIEEEYAAKIMSYESRDLARITRIRNPNVVAWGITKAHRPKTSSSSYMAAYEKMWSTMENDERQPSQDPRICLGSNHVVSLVPSAAKVGDVVVQFWNCNAAMVMRPAELGLHSFVLVGKADVADACGQPDIRGHDLRNREGLLGSSTADSIEGYSPTGSVYVDVDFQTLQRITASIPSSGKVRKKSEGLQRWHYTTVS